MTIRHSIRRSWFVGAFVIPAVVAATRFAGLDTARATEQDTASTKADQFRDNLRHRLDTVEARLKSLRANVAALPEQAETSLR